MIHRQMILAPIPICGTKGEITLTDKWGLTTCKNCLKYQRPVLLTDRNLLAEQLERSVKLLENILASERFAPSLTSHQETEAKAIVALYRSPEADQ
jgi:hypothetical protein